MIDITILKKFLCHLLTKVDVHDKTAGTGSSNSYKYKFCTK